LILQNDHPLKRIDDILGGEGIAAVKLYALPQFKSPGFAVRKVEPAADLTGAVVPQVTPSGQFLRSVIARYLKAGLRCRPGW
jgi:hypothetical protein